MTTRSRVLRSCLFASAGAVSSPLALAASSDGQYFLPGEFVLYVLFLFVPPLLLSFVAQAWVFRSRQVPHPLLGCRALSCFAFTVLASVALATLVVAAEPQALAPVLRIREVSFAGGSWPFSPLAFLAVAVVAPLAIKWGSHRAT
jgi:hypothetical protein